MTRKNRSWKDYYAEIAATTDACCSCHSLLSTGAEQALSVGYSEQEIGSVPQGTLLGLGCGNPTALADLKEGETVLDLGCGGGLDVFLAARRVGPTGRVIGVDLTPEMIERARASARQDGYENVEFRVAEIEKLPLEDASVDVVISNCVINHASDKPAVFAEILRVLKPHGRIHAADLTFEAPYTEELGGKLDKAWSCWAAGAMRKDHYLGAMRDAGFEDVAVVAETVFPAAEQNELLRGSVVSLHVRGYKRPTKT